MIVGCQATTPAELTHMLDDLPGLAWVRIGERLFDGRYAQQVVNARAKSIVMCRNYGALAAQAQQALGWPGVGYVELGNEPYWEGVDLATFVAEVYRILSVATAEQRTRLAVACMEGTTFTPAALLKAEPRLRDVVRVLACHPYDAYGTGPTGPAGVGGTPRKSGGQRYVETHDAWVRLTGHEVDVVNTEFGWCTPPYKEQSRPPTSHPLVSEDVQAAYVNAAFADMRTHGYVKAATVFHYLGWDAAKEAAAEPHNTVRFNGLVHFDFAPKPALGVLRRAIAAEAPAPPPPPTEPPPVDPTPAPPAFVPRVAMRVQTPEGPGEIAYVGVGARRVLVLLDNEVVGNATGTAGYLAGEIQPVA